MTAPRAYLDWNASAPLLPEARAAMLAAMDEVGNPSSIHAEGRASRMIVEEARAEIAALVGGDAEGVVFTSGASEAINGVLRQGLTGGLARAPHARLIIGASEHAAVFAAAGRDTTILPVGPDGRIDQAALSALLADGPSALVAIQLANNETGILQDIPVLGERVHAAAGALVVDAVQGPGRLPIDFRALGSDAIFLSAHKFGGPKGVGAIVFRDGRTRLDHAFIAGGGQERGHRGGTENVIGIAGMGAAARAVRASDEAAQTMNQLRDHFENRLMHIAPDVRIVGKGAPRLANTTCFAIPGLPADKALIAFDLDGVAVSSGSACSSGKVKASHVLKAMGEPDWVIGGAIRVSIGGTTTMDEIGRCLASLEKQVKRIRSKAASAA
jgi:cysteine desulfurase